MSNGDQLSQPAFLRLAAHPLRWQLLTELVGGDLRVQELTALVDQPQNLVSYHLRLLRESGLVRAIRSDVDGRNTYYHLDLDRCAEELAVAGAALHPMLRPDIVAPARRGTTVLFVCSGNSFRSPVAEALLRRRAEHVDVTSAGTEPKPRDHPAAAHVLRFDFGIEIDRDRRPRHVDTVADRPFDHVITLCDRARMSCPEFGPDTRRAHWSVPDPTDHSTTVFRQVAEELDTRIRHLVPTLT
jgi:ArsR family transcriptional regulator, arsenate/arsenite/antimonite-responsive transcriptional repressor / arsenate reductase (thioredoxin)